MKVVNIHAAKTQLSALLAEVANGEEVLIAKAGKPVARLIPVGNLPAPRKPGSMKGRIRISADFDAPLPPEIAKGFGIQ